MAAKKLCQNVMMHVFMHLIVEIFTAGGSSGYSVNLPKVKVI